MRRMENVSDAAEWVDSSDPRRAAAAWHARLDCGELPQEDRQAFADWLRESPAHVSEYLALASIRETLRSAGTREGIDVDALLKQSTGGGVVAPWPDVESLLAHDERGRTTCEQGEGGRVDRKRLIFHAGLAASLLIGFLGFIGWHVLNGSLPLPLRYETAIGEQRPVVLPDGSLVELNTRSELVVRFSREARDVTLAGGEALFHVEKDPQRPFRVRSGDALIQAVGTVFNVRRDTTRTTVTVIEGRVSVGAHHAATQAAAAMLDAGQMLTIEPGVKLERTAVIAVDPARALAWKSRRLEFDAVPLEDVVAEFNRYNPKQIRIENPDLRARRVTGIFDANAPATLISFLQSNSPTLRVSELPDGEWVVR